MPYGFSDLQRIISAHAFEPEAVCVDQLLEHVALYEAQSGIILPQAQQLAEVARTQTRALSIETFLQEYGLDTHEGVALLCIAEALLRIPDSYTATRLIRDKMQGVNWGSHAGHSRSLYVNAASWGLALSGSLADFETKLEAMPDKTIAGVLGGIAGNYGEAAARRALKQAMRLAGSQFVLGVNMAHASRKARAQHAKGYIHSFDMLGEGARTQAQADHYHQLYAQAIDHLRQHAQKDVPLLKRSGISVKLSALHPRYQQLQEKRVMQELYPRMLELVLQAKDAGIPLSMDAEEAARFDIAFAIYERLQGEPELHDYDGLGFVLQAYQKRAVYTVPALCAIAKRKGMRLPVRLVKGAYWDAEIKHAQEQGLADYPVFTRKAYTDVSYMACAKQMLDAPEWIYPQFATHNAYTVAAILSIADGKDFEFQRLHGMGEALHDQLVKNYTCRIYAPVGSYETLLPYLLRRLLENGANTSFVRQLADAKAGMQELLADPIAYARREMGQPNPAIALPAALYPNRVNSQGVEPGHLLTLEAIEADIAHRRHLTFATGPLIQGEEDHTGCGAAHELHEPGNQQKLLGRVYFAGDIQVNRAVTVAHQAFPGWAQRSAHERGQMLCKAADALESARPELLTLLMREAGKTLLDAIAEIREAADFLRYYAMQAETLFTEMQLPGPVGEKNLYGLRGRGVFGCISPWNFPLAIFTGQIAAALAAGNSVVAKPAEQTPLIAAYAVQLMHAAGIPKEVLHVVPGDGFITGTALVSDPRISGVAFTGSTATAREINRILAARHGPIIPFIAETGGINTMIVDSSALLEQALDDILRSAFGSAGQRCSALRLLMVQEDVADALIELIRGGMQQWRVGDPCDVSVDIGPVIDAEAQRMLQQHIARLQSQARLIAQTPLPDGLHGFYVAPSAFELESPAQLREEIFGPVLHVVRFRADRLEDMLDAINASGYALTCGVHSRLEGVAARVKAKVRAGNIYINRGMTGAVVGVQPFGGEGLSGTGPKAGGPYSLLRYASEQSVSINLSAIGGNIELLR